ncbi:MAG: nuclear transport factor 2 family protein [Lutibacter sp.]
MISNFTEREQVVETINRLFYYTDYQEWGHLINEVFSEKITLDMTSLGAQKVEILSAEQICDVWKKGFENIDAVHHQAGNYMVTINGNSAKVKAYAMASHYKKNAKNGPIREFVGSYDFKLKKELNSWKLYYFKFNLKYILGNTELI